jgi:hypothetical protein
MSAAFSNSAHRARCLLRAVLLHGRDPGIKGMDRLLSGQGPASARTAREGQDIRKARSAERIAPRAPGVVVIVEPIDAPPVGVAVHIVQTEQIRRVAANLARAIQKDIRAWAPIGITAVEVGLFAGEGATGCWSWKTRQRAFPRHVPRQGPRDPPSAPRCERRRQWQGATHQAAPPRWRSRAAGRVCPVKSVLDGRGEMPPKGGHSHGPRQTARCAQRTTVATVTSSLAEERTERARLLCPAGSG